MWKNIISGLFSQTARLIELKLDMKHLGIGSFKFIKIFENGIQYGHYDHIW